MTCLKSDVRTVDSRRTTAEGTLPSPFRPSGYTSLVGRLAMPSLPVQVLSPSLEAVLIYWRGPGAAPGPLAPTAILNIILVGLA